MDNSIKEILLSQGFVCTPIKGTSMNPMLYQNRDRVVIEKCSKRLKKGDVALFERADGSLILHRVMKVYDYCYTFCGDNHTVFEYGVKDENVLGVLTGYYKKDKFINLQKSFRYKLYLFFYGKNLFVRRIRFLLRRIFAKNLKKS